MTLLAPVRDAASPHRSAPHAAVEIRGLTKFFPVRRPWMDTILHPLRVQRRAVLRDVNLEVPARELFGLLGPNGAGKTTLFKILSSLVVPDGGSTRVGGWDCVMETGRARGELASVLADERSLYWRLSARENLKVFASLHHLRARERSERVEELLDLVALGDTGEQMVGKFSSGMKQRLLIARALLARPRVLLLDEPTRSLDPISARGLRTFLRDELVGRQGCTVLLATHNAEEAFELCDRIGVLHQGRLLRVGPPEQLRAELRDQAYRFWIRRGDRERFTALVTARVGVAPRSYGEDAWTAVQIQLPGGEEDVAALLADLVRHGIDIGRCEPVQLTLAELIERIVGGGDEGANSDA